jgi:hypothetical protein
MIRRAKARHGGLQAMQREVVPLLLAAFGADGLASDHVMSSLHWHIRHAQQKGIPIQDDVLLMRVLTHESAVVRKNGAIGIGLDHLRTAADQCDEAGQHLKASELMYAASAGAGNAAGEDLQRAWSSLRQLEAAGAGSSASRALESHILSVLAFAIDGGFPVASAVLTSLIDRIAALRGSYAEGHYF